VKSGWPNCKKYARLTTDGATAPSSDPATRLRVVEIGVSRALLRKSRNDWKIPE